VRRSAAATLTVALGCWVLLAGCAGAGGGSDSDTGPVADVIATPDGGADAAPAPDTAAPPDAAADTAGDAPAGADVAPDGAIDAAPDGAPDTTPEDVGPPVPPPPFAVREHAGRIEDEPWLAPRAEQLRTTDVLPALDLRHVAVWDGAVWTASATALYVRGPGDTAFRAVALPALDGPIAALAIVEGFGPVVAAGRVLTLLAGEDGPSPPLETPGVVSGVLSCADVLVVLVGGRLYRMNPYSPDLFEAVPGVTDVLAADCDGVDWLALRPDGLWRLPPGAGAGWRQDWAAPADEPPVALAARDGRVVVATARRVSVVSGPDAGAEWEAARDALPTDGVRRLALPPAGDAGFAVAHAVGVSLRTPAPGAPRAFAHRHSRRWLPADDVRDVAYAPDGSLWVATAGGLSHLTWEETTLAAKAERMFVALADHDRLGFVSPAGRLPAGRPDDAEQPDGPLSLHDDDNDGQWSEEALAALCYAYAATGEERYYQRARRVLDGIALLFDVPAVSFAAVGRERGFPARSVVRDDEGALFDGKAPQPNWHLVSYAGREWYWKDDTSSDETTGHWYGLPLYFDLCARDEAERAEVAALLASLTDTVMLHGFRLVDLGGERTTHGHWDPGTLAVALDGIPACLQHHPLEVCADAWGGGAFLNSLQILGALLGTWHVTGDPRYFEAYERLVTDERYAELATFGEHVVTWTSRPIANVVDHELAVLAFLTLVRYEPDPARRARWQASQLAAWPYEAGERSPVKALALAATTPAALIPEDGAWLADGVRTLREYPDDRREWFVDSGHRTDFRRDPANDRFGQPQFTVVPPYDEVRTMRWDMNPYRIAGGGDGRSRMAPTFWLLPYWGLRYHEALGAPSSGAAP
jgi:hypothetical protein